MRILLAACEQIYAGSPPDQPPEFCTVFNHMVKSGGTTIKTQLEDRSVVEGDAFPGAYREGHHTISAYVAVFLPLKSSQRRRG